MNVMKKEFYLIRKDKQSYHYFKKGKVDDIANYRPICLTNVDY